MDGEKKSGAFEGFSPVVTQRASEVIYEQVRARITSGELRPGDRLPSERRMMEMFQRSRPTIREALRMLARSGYIRTVPGSSGAIVTEPDGQNVQEVMQDALQVGTITLAELGEYRRISERAAVAWAAGRRTDEDIRALCEMLDRMREAVGSYERFVEMDAAFHGLIAAAAKNRVCVTMNGTLSRLNREFLTGRMRDMTPPERIAMCLKIQQMHEAIFEAIRARDASRAGKAMEEHITAFENDLG
ncbi:MAG: FadR family transcriptional regulator [Oscillospiraceae bacterium]|nr:FadR family transcriptional regulator [Oscillospiraceae bacterium]